MNLLARVVRLVAFAGWFAAQVVRSSTRVLRDILTPRDASTPLVLRHRTDCRSDGEVALLAILVSLTPGTLVLALENQPDPTGPPQAIGKDAAEPTGPRSVYVHAMYGSRQSATADLAEMERRMLHAVRGKGRPS